MTVRLRAILLVLCVCGAVARADSSIELKIDFQSPGRVIPADFAGLSYEMSLVSAVHNGTHFFSPSNKSLIQTFRTLGIHSLRVGGNSAERASVKMPDEADIDSLFRFAQAANVKVIYTLRISGDSLGADASTARYILAHYRQQLTCFAIGNEPSKIVKDYAAYRAAFMDYQQAITKVAPEAQFAGPGAMHKTVHWSEMFTHDFAHDPAVALVTQHEYPGKSGRFAVDAQSARRGCQQMLSPKFLDVYQKLYDDFVPAVLAAGKHYRLEEANSFSNGGAAGASDAYASSLWGLDYLYWWASHGASGINFHTGISFGAKAAKPTNYTVFWNAPDGYAIHPLGYALKAFDLASHGRLLPVEVLSNSGGINLRAYAVFSDTGPIYLTLINKEISATRGAIVNLVIEKHNSHAQVIYLQGPAITAETGVKLGGSDIGDDGQWTGKWENLSIAKSRLVIKIPAASAAVVRLSNR